MSFENIDKVDVAGLETALVELFDVVHPQAMPWMGTFSEKASYSAKVTANGLRGLLRVLQSQLADAQEREQKGREALEAIRRLDFKKTADGDHDFYSGPDRFIKAWTIANDALNELAKQRRTRDEGR